MTSCRRNERCQRPKTSCFDFVFPLAFKNKLRFENFFLFIMEGMGTLWLCKSLMRQGLSEPEFYGDLVYKLKKIVGSNNFSAQFIKIIFHYKKICYYINLLQQTACLVVNPITVDNFAFLFNCTLVDGTSDSMTVPT